MSDQHRDLDIHIKKGIRHRYVDDSSADALFIYDIKYLLRIKFIW